MNAIGIDFGTNYLKFSIIQTKPFKILWQKSYKYSLGKSLDDNNNIPKWKIDEVTQICEEVYKLARDVYKCKKYKAVGTAGLRNPANSEELINSVREATGIVIKIISGVTEAQLTYKGALLSFNDPNATYVEMDFGGNSSEFSIGKLTHIIKSKSIDIGSLSLSQLFDLNNKTVFTEDDLNAVLTFLNRKFSSIQIPSDEDVVYILTGSAGFPPLLFDNRSLTDEIIKSEPLWDITFDMIQRLLDAIMKDVKNASNLFNDSDLVLAQTVMLYYIMKKFNIDTLHYSTLGLRHGLVLFD